MSFYHLKPKRLLVETHNLAIVSAGEKAQVVHRPALALSEDGLGRPVHRFVVAIIIGSPAPLTGFVGQHENVTFHVELSRLPLTVSDRVTDGMLRRANVREPFVTMC